MAMQRKKECFVLVFSDDGDPSREETAEALDHLKSFEAEVIVPGTIRVEGSRRAVEKSLSGLDQWQLASEKKFELNPPYKSQFR